MDVLGRFPALSRSRREATTVVVPFCDACPPLSDWPRKHLILGTCPRCGRGNDQAWRLAKALRMIDARGDARPCLSEPYDPNYEPQWRNGAKYGYPECCVESFIVRVMIGGECLPAEGSDGRILCPECSIRREYGPPCVNCGYWAGAHYSQANWPVRGVSICSSFTPECSITGGYDDL